MTDDLHNTILDIARGFSVATAPKSSPEPRIFCAIKQPGEKVCAHLTWIRQTDIERMPVAFLQSNIIMGGRK